MSGGITKMLELDDRRATQDDETARESCRKNEVMRLGWEPVTRAEMLELLEVLRLGDSLGPITLLQRLRQRWGMT